MKQFALTVWVAAFVLAAAACSNPAADKPKAEVGDAIEETDAPAEAGMAEEAEGSEPAMAEEAEGDAMAQAEPAMAEEGSAPGGEAEMVAFAFTDATEIEWVGSKVTGSHDGGFKEVTGQIVMPQGADVTDAKINVAIDLTSIWSDNEKLTEHLKSADFFEVESFPKATFTSTSIEESADGYKVRGNLDLHGIKKSISFPAAIEVSEDALTANAEFAMERFDWGIEYKGMADDLIRNEVVVRLNVEATQQAK